MIGYLLPSFLASLALLVAFWLSIGRSYGPDPIARAFLVTFLLFVAFVLAVATGFMPVVLQLVFTGGALMLCRLADSPTWTRRVAATVAMVAAFAIYVQHSAQQAQTFAVQRTQEVTRLREQFPLRSVADRLAYETRNRAAPIVDDALNPVVLAPEVERQLRTDEVRFQSSYRADVLAQVYRPGFEQEAAAVVYGSQGRLGRFFGSITQPSSRAISLSEPPPRRGCDPPPTEYVPAPAPNDSTAPLIAFREFYRAGAENFLDPERLGYVQDREHVAGFEPHAFQSMPALSKHAGDWKLEHLELVSLRKPSGPHVYVSENLPKVDDLKRVDTRLLTDFETRALSQLRSGDDVVIEESDGALRMLGSLRAGNHCIRCHSGRRGELIGALSFELHRKTEHEAPQIAASE